MRILLLSDAVWLHPPSGYSKIAGQLSVLLSKSGHNVGHIPIDHALRGVSQVHGHFMTWHGVLLLDSGGDVMSESNTLEHYYEFKADFLLTFKDIWNFRWLSDYPINFIPIVPIDHKPVSKEVTARIRKAFRVITITRFGKRELKKAGVPSTYIPLFVDSDLYKPMIDRTVAKQTFGLPPDCFGILILAMNRRRKMIPRMLRACKRFLDDNPDARENTKIILWTNILPEFATPDGARGTMLGPVSKRLGLQQYIFSPDPKFYSKGLEEARMPLLYNASDVLLCGCAEGFGMPLVEGGCCGVPSVVVEAGAAPEVSTGELARVLDWDVMNPIGYDQPLVDIGSMADGIAKIYNGDRIRYAKNAREYSLKYDIMTVWEKYWMPFLESIECELRPYIKKKGIESWKIA